RFQSNEWAIYTFRVQLAGDYVVSLRARGASGGRCNLLFEDPDGGVTSFDPPALSGTGWQNLEVVVPLAAGSNRFQITGKNEAGGFAAAINYISIYPYIAPQTFPTNI